MAMGRWQDDKENVHALVIETSIGWAAEFASKAQLDDFEILPVRFRNSILLNGTLSVFVAGILLGSGNPVLREIWSSRLGYRVLLML